ncbi:MAG TPA: hypothetical protein ENH82_00850, partial [bacterium]|nr:hypothetical protein [bacterium]
MENPTGLGKTQEEEKPIRTKKGRFVPGVSGNPEGSKKSTKFIGLAVKRQWFLAFHELGGLKGLVTWGKTN